MKKIKEFCFHSTTIALSYIFGILGVFLDVISTSPDLFGDNLRQDVTQVFGPHSGYVMLVISVAVFSARMRSLRK